MNKETRDYLMFLWERLDNDVKKSFHDSFDNFVDNWLGSRIHSG